MSKCVLIQEYKVAENDISYWNESALLNWVLENFAQPVARIIPMWKKAFSFEKYVDGNPILMLFTPLNPLYEQLPAYSLVSYTEINVVSYVFILFVIIVYYF